MKNIAELLKILPIRYDNKKLSLITYKDINWYYNNCIQPYYNEYLDFDFANDVTEERFKAILKNLVVGYKNKLSTYGEARMLLKDENNNIIAGCSFIERIDDIEIAYFVLPNYQHQGIAYEMLDKFISTLSKSNFPYKRIISVVREDNIQSIKLMEKLGFKLERIDDGKKKKNNVFILERDRL